MEPVSHTESFYSELSSCIRVLTADAVEHAASGHPGMPIGMADVMTILAFNFLQFNPHDPTWFNRDRLVLSAGHGSMLLYTFYYLTGYRDFTLDDLKNFRKLHSKTPGHPEYGAYQAIETTTGPLGQGFANAVGMAIAGKKYQQTLGKNVSDYKIYCIVGDGCLMEGISYEAASIAGHLGLNNLVVLFDDNKISIDGKISLTISENQLAKFVALGWNIDSIDGHNFAQINASLERAQISEKPYFIACRTIIAKGCANKADSELAHGSPLGVEEIRALKNNLQMVGEAFHIPERLKTIWGKAWEHNKEFYEIWQSVYTNLSTIQQNFLKSPHINTDFLKQIQLTSTAESTRASSGKVIQQLMQVCDKVICGSSDLSLSNNVKNATSKIITKDDFSGNFIHYGVREHAMAAIMNGLSLSGFLPIGSTFLVFSDYMKPAVRLAAMMGRQVIYIMTHDSIGVGEDGATHQPVEHLAAMRAIPNMRVMRPADCAETIECWSIALSDNTRPHMLVLSRQNLPQIKQSVDFQHASAVGGYRILPKHISTKPIDVKIFATGSELQIALSVSEILSQANIITQVVSMPSIELFLQQDLEYRQSILGRAKLTVAIEAASSFGWQRIIGTEGLFFGVDQFGLSAPAGKIYEYFGLTTSNIASKIKNRLLAYVNISL